MSKFQVEIKETLGRVVEVEADNLLEALALVEAQWDEGEIILDAGDFFDVSFEEFENG